MSLPDLFRRRTPAAVKPPHTKHMTLDLTHLETLLAAATPGPWYSDNYARVWDSEKMDLCCMEATFDPPDICLIVALRNAAPLLIARIRELENKLSTPS